MIEKRLLFGRGRNCMRWIAFSALIVLIFLSLTAPVFAQVVDTYESDYSTTKDSYALGETVYAKATGLGATQNYDFHYDSSVQMEFNDVDVQQDPHDSGEWKSSYTLAGDDPTGGWNLNVIRQQGSKLECSAPFTVTGVPEFPSIFAFGAGMMFLICGAIYLGMRKHAVRKV